MRALRTFEIEVIRLLGESSLDKNQLEALAFADSAEYEYTGTGYFLTLRLPGLPTDRQTLHDPVVMGKADGIECGFVVFLEQRELMLECHSWGLVDVPNDFRDRNFVLSTPDIN